MKKKLFVNKYVTILSIMPWSMVIPDGFANLLHLISDREGIGDTLALGIKHASKKWELEDIAVHVKGMEPAGYDPRSLKAWGWHLPPLIEERAI